MEAAKYKSLNVIAIGGSFPRDGFFCRDFAQASLSEMNIRTAFMGATGVTIENGSQFHRFEAEIKKMRCLPQHANYSDGGSQQIWAEGPSDLLPT